MTNKCYHQSKYTAFHEEFDLYRMGKEKPAAMAKGVALKFEQNQLFKQNDGVVSQPTTIYCNMVSFYFVL